MGGGAAHAYMKCPKGWQAAVVPGGDHPGKGAGKASTPQAIVNDELEGWTPLWKASSEPAASLPPWPIVQRLVPMLEAELRRTCNSYKWRTGLSLDQLHPRHAGLCSDTCLYTWGYFFFCCEVSGLWADPMEFFSFFLMLEATGRFRTIGLMSDVYRMWAKIRMPLVRA